MFKKFSLILIIVSSMTVVVSQIITLTGNNILGSKMLGGALIAFGVGTIVYSVYTLLKGGSNKRK